MSWPGCTAATISTTLRKTAGRAVMLDPDTFTSPESHEIALLAAGAAVDAAREAYDVAHRNVRAGPAARPSRRGRSRHGLLPVQQHRGRGNGAASRSASSAWRSWTSTSTTATGRRTRSTKTRPCCTSRATSFRTIRARAPRTKPARDAGRGATLNVPLAAGATDDVYLRAYESKVIPAIDAFKPDILLVSAGYDAHERDPLAGMRLTVSGYARLAGLLKDAADRHCPGRTAWVTEGGYHLGALRECLDATIGVLT